ncbi:MAG: hypothetical protein FJX76_13185 [Armatimonadetes bacterium]|nr:hypothetical protein [Armatimonadota bacterium]
MSDVKPAPTPKPNPAPYQPKGPTNTGGYEDKPFKDEDGLFRTDAPGGDYEGKGATNVGGYKAAKDKKTDDVVRKEEPAHNHDPLFTDKVDIKFSPSK